MGTIESQYLGPCKPLQLLVAGAGYDRKVRVQHYINASTKINVLGVTGFGGYWVWRALIFEVRSKRR